jgi:putative membrane protein
MQLCATWKAGRRAARQAALLVLCLSAAGPALGQTLGQAPQPPDADGGEFKSSTINLMRSRTPVDRGESGRVEPMPLPQSRFLSEAATSVRFAIDSSHLALARSSRADVQQLATDVIRANTALLNQLWVLTGYTQTPLPEQPGPRQRDVLADLSRKSGDDFDRLYADLQVQLHQETVVMYSTAARDPGEPVIRTAAIKELPVLLAHQSQALEIARELTLPLDLSPKEIRLEDIPRDGAPSPRQRMQPRADDLGTPAGVSGLDDPGPADRFRRSY